MLFSDFFEQALDAICHVDDGSIERRLVGS